MKAFILKILFFLGGSIAIMYGSFYFFSMNDPKIIKITPPESCDLQNFDCTIPLPHGGNLLFEMKPRPVPAADPFTVSVKLINSNLKVQNVMVDFAGLLEDTGYRRPHLDKISDTEYKKQTDLTHCKEEEMLWQITVLVKLEKDTLAVPFKLRTFQKKAVNEVK